MLLECPVTIDLFQQKMDMTSMIVITLDILYNTDIIISIVKLIVHSPVSKLVYFCFVFCFESNITSM